MKPTSLAISETLKPIFVCFFSALEMNVSNSVVIFVRFGRSVNLSKYAMCSSFLFNVSIFSNLFFKFCLESTSSSDKDAKRRF